MDWKNRLYFGDNLDILRREVPDASVDLIYLDPPFNSNANYNVLFKEKSGEESAAQITAFEDTWQWSLDSYIKACEDNGLLKDAISKLADSARQFRNIVHLKMESSAKYTISKATAKAAMASVFTIANDFGP
jgi:DNA modification methylase